MKADAAEHSFKRKISETVRSDVSGRPPRQAFVLRSVLRGQACRHRSNRNVSLAGTISACGPRQLPASRTIWTIFFDVVPRTIESSTRTIRLPRMRSRMGFSLSLTPNERIDWDGSNERPADVMVADDRLTKTDARLGA